MTKRENGNRQDAATLPKGALRRPYDRKALRLNQDFVHVRAAVAEKLPGFANLRNHVEIEVGGEDLVLVAGGLGENLAAWVAEIAGAVEFTDVPGSFGADAVDGGDEVAVGGGVGGLLK